VVYLGPLDHRTTPRPIRRARVALVAALLVMASCSGDDEAIPDSSTSISSTTSTTDRQTSTTQTGDTPSTSTSTSAPVDDVEALVADRYLEFWDARFEANLDPVDPDNPRLRDLATGEQLANVIDETQRRKDAGLAFREADDSVKERRIRVVDVQSEVATLQDCATNDDVVYRVATGEVVDDSVVTRNISAEMRLVDGQWRLAGAQELQKWEGVAGCALSDS
jgi:hypothetical protein